MSQTSKTAAVVANVIQLASDTLVETLGPDVAHQIGDEKITAGSIKSLIKAEIVRAGLVKESDRV